MRRGVGSVIARILFVALWIVGVSLAVLAQAQVDDAAPIEYVNPQGQLLPWLYRAQMDKELEIVSEQKQAIAKLRAESMAKLRDLYKFDSQADPREQQKNYNAASKKMAVEIDKQVADVLMPHQVRRLRQIALQMRMASASYGLASAFSADIAEELGITDEQKARLREKEKEVTKEIREKTQEFYKKLQEDAREKMLSVLTAEQRLRLKQLIGEKFEWQTQQPAKPADGETKKTEPKPADGK